ncbi:MAG: hypothetical protein AAGC60_01495 [Acidobacteriota bacterium]
MPSSQALCVALGIVLLLGCALLVAGCSRTRSWADVVRGAVVVEATDRAAVDELLRAHQIAPEGVQVVGADGRGEAAGARRVHVDSGRVTVLAFDRLARPVRLVGAEHAGGEAFTRLRDVRLAGSFEALEVQGLPALTSLSAFGENESLRRVVLDDVPVLADLLVSGGDLSGTGLDLSRLDALRTVDLAHLGLRQVPALPAGVESLSLEHNALDDGVAGLERLAELPALRRLSLAGNGLRSLHRLPPLPSLRSLYLHDNPLSETLDLAVDDYPALRRLGVERTAVRTLSPGLAAREDLRLGLTPEVEAEQELVATLERLRASYAAAGERVAAPEARSGRIEGRSGRCNWRTSTLSSAKVTCSLTFERLTGRAQARLGTTDPAMPYSGGGAPTVRVTLRVGRGSAAVYFRESYDLVELAARITDVDAAVAERFRGPDDRFDGYRRHVATPDAPAVGTGRPSLLGSSVLLWIEALEGPAEDLALEIEPAF